MENSGIDYLLKVYFNETASEKEIAELMCILNNADNDAAVQASLDKAWEQFTHHNQLWDEDRKIDIYEQIAGKINASKTVVKHSYRWYKIAAAAAIAGVVITLSLFFNRQYNYKKLPPIAVTTPKKDIAPGKDKAVLTLDDGTKIDLDSLQNNSSLSNSFKKGNSNELVVSGAQEIKYNTLSTPQGGKYKVILPDGSIVWLNAASSLYFPTAFTGEKREVTLTGEAYFEIAKNEKQPFFVKVKNMEVAVLGTHFNIMAYNNENTINTTLLEGSVKVQQGASSNYLKPGQQSAMDENGNIKIGSADIDEVMAWKNDLFVFKGYDFDKIMRQVARWYNVTVMYNGKIPSGKYSGVIGRNNNVSQVLKILEASGVSFKIEGDKITVE